MSPAGFVQALFEGRALVLVEFFTKRQRRKSRKISKAVPLLFHQQFDGRLWGVTISSQACSSGSRMDYGARACLGNPNATGFFGWEMCGRRVYEISLRDY